MKIKTLYFLRLIAPLLLLGFSCGCVDNAKPPPQYSIAKPSEPLPPSVLQTPRSEDADWDAVKGSTNPDDVNAFLAMHPDGEHANMAKLRLKLLSRGALKN